jgi:hypothetical protein
MFGIEIILGKASGSIYIASYDDFEFSFAGLVTQPALTIPDIIKQMSNIEGTDFLKYLEFGQSEKRIMFGTIGSDLDNWLIGYQYTISFVVFGTPIVSGFATLEISPEHFFIELGAELALIGEAKLTGEIKTNGDMSLEGYIEAGLEFDVDILSLEIEFYQDMLMYVAYPDWGFHASGYFYGEVCCTLPPWGGWPDWDVCASLEIGYSVDINSDGTFEICTQFGVDGFGFDVCLNFDFDKNTPDMVVNNIPYSVITEKNKFYSEDYQKSHPEIKIDKSQYKKLYQDK